MSQVYVQWSHAVSEIGYAAGRRAGHMTVVMDPALSIGAAMEILQEIAPDEPVRFAPVSQALDSERLHAV